MTALGCPQWRAQPRQGDYGQRQTPCMPCRARLPPSPLVFNQSTLSELDHRLASNSSISSSGTQFDDSSFYSASPCYSASASLDYHSLSAPTSISSASSDWSHGRLMESQKQQLLLQKSTWSFTPPTAQLSEILDRSARECLPYVDPVWPTLDPLAAQQEIDRDLTDLCKRFGAVLREEEGRPELKREKYKTEMCRSWEEQGHCRYGDVCQFAHGPTELRTVPRHPKYKTELCRAFYRTGTCPYAKRCIFIHTSADIARSEGLHEHGVTKSPLFTRVGFQTAPELQQQRQQQQHHAVSKSSPPKQHFAPADVSRAESNLSATDKAFHAPDQELPYFKTNKTFLPSLDWLISHFLDRHARTSTPCGSHLGRH